MIMNVCSFFILNIKYYYYYFLFLVLYATFVSIIVDDRLCFRRYFFLWYLLEASLSEEKKSAIDLKIYFMYFIVDKF